MKKQAILSFFLLAGLEAMACTNFIVGKKASADGSVICSYNADDYGMFIGLAHYAAGKHLLFILPCSVPELHARR